MQSPRPWWLSKKEKLRLNRRLGLGFSHRDYVGSLRDGKPISLSIGTDRFLDGRLDRAQGRRGLPRQQTRGANAGFQLGVEYETRGRHFPFDPMHLELH